MSGDLLPVSREEKIKELEREIAKRRFVFPRMVTAGKLKSYEADRRIEILEAIVVDYHKEQR